MLADEAVDGGLEIDDGTEQKCSFDLTKLKSLEVALTEMKLS